MSKYGGSEKKKNNTSFCCSISQAEAFDSLRGTHWHPPPLDEDDHSALCLPHSPSPSLTREFCWIEEHWQDSPCWILQDP